jgi:hypothetical protein
MRIIAVLIFVMSCIASSGQVAISPYISAGYAEHLKFNGINLELGIESEFFQRVDITLNYRYMNADKEIKVSAISANISYVFINRDNHRLMLGPGFSYGNYKRSTGTPGYDKDHTSTWFDWCKIRYDYTLCDRYRLGLIASLYGDDGDGTIYVGVVAGFKL